MKPSQKFSELLSEHYFRTDIFKGAYFPKNVGGFTVLVLCKLHDDVLYLYQVLWKYLKGIQRYWADMISKVKFSKGHNSV